MRYAVIIALTLLGACSMYRVDNGLLTNVPEVEMEKVRAARGAHSRAVDELARCARERGSAEDRVEIAEAEYEVARAELGTARIKARLAGEEGTRLARASTKAVVEHCEATLRAAELAIELRKCELDIALRREELAERTVELRDAEVELTEARAVKQLDHAAAQSIVLTQFELQVKERERAVANAELSEMEASERKVPALHKYEAAQREATRLGSVVAMTGVLVE